MADTVTETRDVKRVSRRDQGPRGNRPVNAIRCPALFISAPASGQGKTTITAGLARLFRNRGRQVRVFKTGPDFLDPMVLARGSGAAVYQLDLWMGGEDHCRELLYRAAGAADVILIEGVMGLFDGRPSSAEGLRHRRSIAHPHQRRVTSRNARGNLSAVPSHRQLHAFPFPLEPGGGLAAIPAMNHRFSDSE